MSLDIKRKENEWLSLYIFYSGALDALLKQLVRPFIDAVFNIHVEQYFFIRYYEKGSHIRLRLKGNPTVLDLWVKPLLEKTFASSILDQEPLTLKYEPYVQEIDRYGGIQGVELAEEIFQSSSKVVLKILDDQNWNYQKAIGPALQLNLIFIYSFFEDRNEVIDFLNYIKECRMTFQLEDVKHEIKKTEERKNLTKSVDERIAKLKDKINPILQELWRTLSEEIVFEDIFINEWRCDISLIAEKFNRNQNPIISSTAFFFNTKNFNFSKWILFDSYIHMTNNRLGILPGDEIYIYYILGGFIKTIY